MAHTDRYDFPLSTSSGVAAERYQTGVDLLLSLWPGAEEALEAAIALDPAFALPVAARARLHAIRSETTIARALVSKAQTLVSVNGTERERSHVEVLSLAITGQSAKALAAALTHADRWPRDILILSLPLGAFGLFAFSGMADHDQARVDLCERHARHFDDSDWWFLTYRGWAHGENGNIQRGLCFTERALELRRHNVNAAHAFAHVMYEAGASDSAERFLDGWLPEYPRSGVLHNHIAWHIALISLERDDIEGALNIYNANVAPAVTTAVPVNVVSDTSSFLWRLQAYGHSVPKGMWEDVAKYSAAYFQQAGFPFADLHMAMISAATGDKEGLQRRSDALVKLVEAGKLPAGPVVPALCDAARAFVEEEYARCAQILEPVAMEVARIGGSGAQREVVEDTLLVALMRSGDVHQARALLDRRLHRRPSPRDTRWLSQLVTT
ncbi:tetratricopeptide repeat protein [Paraburkholderia sp. JHI869]|uniref:tetratricopeptide repeat protein n=1 Tax=Paraburkholderia sp. JHI869 TaxID=3112959 RepID=UPI003178C901